MSGSNVTITSEVNALAGLPTGTTEVDDLDLGESLYIVCNRNVCGGRSRVVWCVMGDPAQRDRQEDQGRIRVWIG